MSAPATRRGTIRAIAGPLAGALAVFALAACRTAVPTYPSSDPRPAETTRLTPDGTDEYAYTSSAGAMEVVALDTNTAGNLRSAFTCRRNTMVERTYTNEKM